ncbi:Hypothetical predicted protein [Octopus vulgaris]|uniref:Uncharacterized protein n=2 Tax=Octopus TaxID=6643 RepID=A0AA36AXC2_OCTVU|nr:SAGA-associated factor 29 isoform X1 [Octopus sinensis]XP_029638212.1 SAGA-associated factor 29 isoform X2 [Octopus sinensis]XP_036360035.1 SAGA-associated factor 29 isoform X1 [Octopus sinensis]CAI9724021.1 Hypothetical predicted protein [Octopus vulgaris]
MGRTKASGNSSHASHNSSPSNSDLGLTNSTAEIKMKEILKDLYHLIIQVQEERARGEHNLSNISKTHERMQQEQRNNPVTTKGEAKAALAISFTPYYKNKLRGLYNTAMQDAEAEAELVRKALDKISEIKSIQENRRLGKLDSDRPKPIIRRGVLMTMLQQNAVSLPLWVSKPGEKPPPLCGAVPADANYVGKTGDKVAARVKGQDGEEENWILAEISSYTPATGKYEVDDIDAEESNERHSLSRRRIVPLPIWKANPETDPDALFPKETLVLALYPQTTCFYRALIHEPPKRPQDDYQVLFEDTSYSDGYSPPLGVAQRYVIACKEEKRK